MENIDKIAELLEIRYKFKKEDSKHKLNYTLYRKGKYSIRLDKDCLSIFEDRDDNPISLTYPLALFRGVVSVYTLPVIMEAVIPPESIYVIEYDKISTPNLYIHGRPYVYSISDSEYYLYDARGTTKDGYWYHQENPNKELVYKKLLETVASIAPTLEREIKYEYIGK